MHKLLLLAAILFPALSFSQCVPSVNTTYQLVFGTPGHDRAHSVVELSNGGYIIASETDGQGAGGEDILLTKHSATGQIIWSRTYGSGSDDHGNSISLIPTPDQGAIVGGWTQGFGAQGAWDGLLFRVDAIGIPMWSYRFPGSSSENIRGMKLLPDGTIAATGNSGTNGLGNLDRWLLQFDMSGNVLVSEAYGLNHNEQSTDVDRLASGNFLLTGSVSAYGGNAANINAGCLTMTNAAGGLVWNQIYESPIPTERTSTMASALDSIGGFVTVGFTESFGAIDKDILVFRSDSSGQVIWAKRIGTSGSDRGVSVEVLPDGNFRIVGFSDGFVSGSDIVQIHMDVSGNIIEIVRYASQAEEFLDNWGSCFHMTSDGGFILAGGSNGFGSSGEDVYMVKLDDCALSKCNEEVSLLTESTIPLSATNYPLNTVSPPPPTTVTLTNSPLVITPAYLCADTSIKNNIIDLASIEAREALILPNPASSLIELVGFGSGNYQIVDMAGRIVLTGSTRQSRIIDIGFLEPQLYVVRFFRNDGGEIHLRFLKN